MTEWGPVEPANKSFPAAANMSGCSGVLLRAVENGQEITLAAGKTVVGRGPFLAVADKHVSRSHAVLEVVDGSLTVLPIHTNPTFYKPKGKANFADLKKDKPTELQHGDFISLLPNKYIFEVVYENKNTTPGMITDKNTDSGKMGNGNVVADQERPSYPPGGNHKEAPRSVLDELMDHDPSSSTSALLTSPEAEGSCSAPKDQPSTSALKTQACSASSSSGLQSTVVAKVDGAPPPKKMRQLPSWMGSAAKTKSKQEKKHRPSEKKIEDRVKNKDKGARQSSEVNSTETGDNGGESAVLDGVSQARERKTKLAHESDGETSEPEDDIAASEKEEKITKRKMKRARTTDDAEASDSANDLPPCPYGTSCYRKNPVHFQEYSHPTKEDSEAESEEDRPECPYGSSCYRRNPQHTRDFKHTAAPGRPKRKAAKKTARKSVLDGESDDDGEQNTYDHKDSFLVESESSSYDEGSGDSDWTPQVKADEDEQDDEEAEDVSELLSEARGFLRNKKMTKPV